MGKNQIEKHPFAPIVSKDSRFLILGSFPSLKSFTNNFYYGNPANQFWKILSIVYPDDSVDLKEVGPKEKKDFLIRNRIALFDVYQSAKRKNNDSSDTNLTSRVINDFASLLQSYPSIKKIGINSKRAYKDFEKNFWLDGGFTQQIELVSLPSPSRRYAEMSVEVKATAYKEFLQQ